ncbi:NAD+ synthase (glutamine-hydrolysing) [Pontibacter ummariensis]|uniref:Glutamine-dependent NAD(+) synthetase n=1 Tax=Pontibacter ummariensis TaxID=1610492 RepID=A0A239EGC6_9BACT|nr:NAD(+) synthase [Pontibacter ummariensis]PRY13219.1 NAD+ synthase (glutamine-hydrolysing) [Pontibacter ummariensis]SNS43063.1 NAD+ synthase (glutamine-hydrolysing) [Pontibacter ummariensis]
MKETRLNLAAAALNQTPMDWGSNLQNIQDAVLEAASQKADILLLPELCITGYGCEDMFLSPWLSEVAFDKLLQIKEWCANITVAVGLPVFYNYRVYNTACIIRNKEIVGFAAKQFLANDGVHYEPRWFTPWPANVVEEFVVNGQRYPIGDIIFEEQGVKYAFEICEDAWRPNRPAERHIPKGVDLILNPSASHFALSKTDLRHRLVVEASQKYHCAYVYANMLGNEAGRVIYDGEVLIAQNGQLIRRNELLCFKDVDMEIAEVCFSQNPEITEVIEYLPPIDENSELTSALSLALFDYMRKSRSRGFVLSLSGGADSSLCAVAVAEMVHRGIGSLGVRAFARKSLLFKEDEITHLETLGPDEVEKAIVGRLLTCAYQGTVNSSDNTYNSAKELAKSIGAVFYNWTIDEEVKGYTKKIEHVLERELTWEQDDITLQNIQARVRAPGIWMLANIKYALLLATSNRSEASVGYATMDGDTAGSISPIAGIDKAFIRQFLIWAQQELGYEGLQYVNNLQPSAELRPSEEEQTDEKDLMPYEVLNQIERLAFHDRYSPEEVYQMLLEQGIAKPEVLKAWLTKFYSLWARNQWKRERYAPSFHLDDYNVDPRSWLRFPILSGGFKDELSRIQQL